MTRIDEDEGLDPKERVLEAMLGEAVRREATPDLVARVQAALRPPAAADPGIVRLPRHGHRVLAFLGGSMVGAAAAAVVAVALGRHGGGPGPAPAVAWHVADGCLQWQGRGGADSLRAGATKLWPIASGDRLRTCDQSAALCDLSSLGRLHMAKGTEIEVAAMEWKSFGGGTALGAVTVAVVSGAIRWSGGGEPVQAHQGESVELRAQAPNLAAARIDDLTRQVESLQQELAGEQARARDLEAKAARTVAANAEQVAAADGKAPLPPERLKHAVTWAGMEGVLEKIDWDVTGKCMHEMTAKLDAVLAALEQGEEMPLELIAEVQQLNAELIKQAGALIEAKVPGTGPNGVFTNPVVAANQIHATLEKAGIPLDAQQRDALQRLSAQVAGEDEARRAALGADEFELAGVIGETELKDRFYAEARRLLTPEQERMLFPARLAGTRANLFDSGLVWGQFAKQMPVRDRADLAAKMTDALRTQADLGDDLTPQLRAAVDAWVKHLPEDTFGAPSKFGDSGLGKTGPVRDIAKRQLALMRDLARTLPLTAEQKAKLRKAGAVYMPVRR